MKKLLIASVLGMSFLFGGVSVVTATYLNEEQVQFMKNQAQICLNEHGISGQGRHENGALSPGNVSVDKYGCDLHVPDTSFGVQIFLPKTSNTNW